MFAVKCRRHRGGGVSKVAHNTRKPYRTQMFAARLACPRPSSWVWLAPIFLVGLASSFAPASRAQVGGRTQSTSPMPAEDTLVTVVVSVRELGGGPLQGSAVVKLSSDFKGLHLTQPTRDAGNATFPSVRTGDYQV